jgi:fucose 4-O-acetylase-like acetyltransferase
MDPAALFESFFRAIGNASCVVQRKIHELQECAQQHAAKFETLNTFANATAHRVSCLFEQHKDLLAFAVTSTVVAVLDITRFLPGLAMGTCGTIIASLATQKGHGPDLPYTPKEYTIAQLALCVVCCGNWLIRTMATNPYWSRQPQEIGVSAFVSGVLAGVMLVTAAKRIYSCILHKEPIQPANAAPQERH